MIAQIQTSGATPATAPAGAAPKSAAAAGFAALMQGSAAKPAAGLDQPQPQAQLEAAEGNGAGETPVADAPDLPTADGLIALLDTTLAKLHQGAGQITPKTVLTGFSEALGEPPADNVAALQTVAALADPNLEMALQTKIDGALRLSSGASQLSVASASVPVVGRGTLAAGGPKTQTAVAALAGKQVLSTNTAAPASSGPSPLGQTPAAAVPQKSDPQAAASPSSTAGQVAAPVAGTVTDPIADATGARPAAPLRQGQGVAAAPTAVGSASQGAVDTKGQITQPTVNAAAGAGVAAGLQSPAPAVGQDSSRPPGMIRRLDPSAVYPGGAPARANTTPLGLGADMPTPFADPRLAATEQVAAGAEAVKAGQTAATGPTEAALRETFGGALPQPAQNGEMPRLSAPSPTPAPPPNPAAPAEDQLRQHVTQQIRGLDVSDNKMRFSLSPFGMGEIEIEVVRNESGRLQIAMTTESAAVLNVLRQDREQLLDALQARGLSADSADLDFQTFGERGRQDGRGTQALPQDPLDGALPADDTAPSADPGAAGTPRRPSGPGQLDILT